MSSDIIDSQLWTMNPRACRRLLNQYLRGQLTYPQLKIKLYYMRRDLEKVNQVKLEI